MLFGGIFCWINLSVQNNPPIFAPHLKKNVTLPG